MSLRPALRFYQHRGHKLKTPPAIEPVTADELRDHLVADATELPDAAANDWIAAARELIEETYGIAMIDQVWEMALDDWPTWKEPWWDGMRQIAISEIAGVPAEIELPRFPLQSVDVVTTFDIGSNPSTVTIAETFDIDIFSTPGRMALQSGATWPVALRPTNAVLIEYTAGYGTLAADVPNALRLAVKQVAAYMYNHRGDGCDPKDALDAGAGIMSRYEVRRI
jgi:hypothetical protein